MSLLIDACPPPGSLENLPHASLIPLPVNTFAIDDVYILGESSSFRWRTFINCENWDPRQYHDKLLANRAYHSRACWEASYLLSFTDSTWLSTSLYQQILDTAHYELRKAEMEILSYQLTCGTLGIIVADNEALFNCSAMFYTTMMWFAGKCLKSKKTSKENRKEYADLVHMKPYRHHGPKQLAVNLDRLIHGVHVFLQNFAIISTVEELPILVGKLKLCIQFVDPVIKIL